MSLKRVQREKGRTPSPSPITIYSNQINRQKKSSVFTKTQHPFSSRRLSSKQEHSKSLKHKNKYRIITEPIEHFNKIQHLVNSNVFGNASFTRLPDKDKNKEKEKMRSSDKGSQVFEQRCKSKIVHECPNCVAQREKNESLVSELEYYKLQTQKIATVISNWREGRITIDQFKQSSHAVRETEPEIVAMRELLEDLVYDIESLSKIDLVKMLKSEVFVYEDECSGDVGAKIGEAKEILIRLKGSMVNPLMASVSVKGGNEQMMFRNLRARMNSLLRENMELKIKLQMMTQEMDVSSVNTDNLKLAIHHAIRR